MYIITFEFLKIISFFYYVKLGSLIWVRPHLFPKDHDLDKLKQSVGAFTKVTAFQGKSFMEDDF